MRQKELTKTLQELVRRHGLSSILRSLAEIRASSERSTLSSSSKRDRVHKASRKKSALDYVAKMSLPPEKTEVMQRAAQRFEDGRFLPSIADIREFCRVYRVELAKSSSRANSIPRVFKFLAALDVAQVSTILDEGAFSGPARLAPIADAIRDHPTRRLRTHPHDYAQPISEKTNTDSTRNR